MIYLAGISPRSGTNWLYDLIVLHPECMHERIGEDHVLFYAHLLETYASKLGATWNADWQLARHSSDESILRALGKSLKAELVRVGVQAHANGTEAAPIGAAGPAAFVAKTPSTRNIHLFRALFPDSRLIVLVRDGRSVAESIMRSFGRSFEPAVGRWKHGAREILRYQSRADSKESMLIVRYEDLLDDQERELHRIFEFAGLDVESYDFSKATDLPVRGSSTFGRSNGRISWNPVQKSEDFDPSKRWEGWSATELARFDDLAGAELDALGYERIRPPMTITEKARYAAWRAWKASRGSAVSGSRYAYRAIRDRLT